MKKFVVTTMTIALFAATGCSKCETEVDTGGNNTHLELSGQYLGQEAPGSEPELFAPGLISTGAQELSLCVSPDGQEIFYFVTGPAFNPRIIMQTRLEKSGWTAPREVDFFSPDRSDSYPFVAPDGQSVYFCSGRSSVEGAPRGHHHEIWKVDRAGEGWGEPVKLGFGDDGTAFGTFPSVAANGNLYFNGGSDARGSDIFVSRFDGERYGAPENLGDAVNSDGGDFHPFIAPNESYLLFDSQRENGGYGSNDLYMCLRKPDGSWGEAKNLGESVNTEYGDMRPFVTADGAYLFFASSRPVDRPFPDTPLEFEDLKVLVNGPGNRLQDIYWVRTVVLRDFLQ